MSGPIAPDRTGSAAGATGEYGGPERWATEAAAVESKPQKPASSRWKRVAMVLKLAVSAGLIWYLLRDHAPGFERFASIQIGPAVLALCLLLVQPAFAAMRWGLVLRYAGSTAPARRIFAVYYVSFFFMQILPSIGGDVVKVLYHKLLEVKAGLAIVSVLIDRGLAVFSLILVAGIALPSLQRIDTTGTASTGVLVVVVAALTGVLFLVLALPWGRRRTFWQRIPAALRVLADAMHWALASRVSVLKLLPASILVHLLSIAAMYCVGVALDVGLSPWEALALAPIILLAQVLPISFGGWGVREAAAIYFLQFAGVEPASALALSIIFGVMAMLAALPGAVCWLALRR